MDIWDFIIGVLLIVLGVLILILEISKMEFRGSWFGSGRRHSIVAAFYIIVLGLIYVFRYL